MDPRGRRRLLSAFEVAVLVGLLAVLVVGLWSPELDRPLGWDESIYAIGARALLDPEAPSTSVTPYRPIGAQVLVMPGVLAGGSERVLRAVACLWSALAFVAFWALGRRTFERWATLGAVALLLTVPEVRSRFDGVLNDLPSLGLLCLTLAVLVREMERQDGPSWRVLWVAPLAAATFYVRYGAFVSLGISGLAGVALWWRAIARRPGIAAATAGLLALLLAPHVVQAVSLTGSPMGILAMSADAAHQEYMGEGLRFYWENWFPLCGRVVGGATIVGAVFGLVLAGRRMWRRGEPVTTPGEAGADSDRPLLFLWIVALSHLAITGLTAHGEIRYVFPTLFFLTGLGVHAVARLLSRPLLARPALAGGLTVALAAGLAVWYWELRPGDASKTWKRSIVKLASDRIRADGDGACSVISNESPRVTWYSGCSAWKPSRRPACDVARLTGDRRYILLFERSHVLSPERRRKILAAADAVAIAHIEDPHGRGNHADLYRVGPRPKRCRRT